MSLHAHVEKLRQLRDASMDDYFYPSREQRAALDAAIAALAGGGEAVMWQCRSAWGDGFTEWQECSKDDYDTQKPLFADVRGNPLATQFRALFTHPAGAVQDEVSCYRLVTRDGRPSDWVDGVPSEEMKSYARNEDCRIECASSARLIDREVIASAIRSTGHVTNSDKWEVADAVIAALNHGGSRE